MFPLQKLNPILLHQNRQVKSRRDACLSVRRVLCQVNTGMVGVYGGEKKKGICNSRYREVVIGNEKNCRRLEYPLRYLDRAKKHNDVKIDFSTKTNTRSSGCAQGMRRTARLNKQRIGPRVENLFSEMLSWRFNSASNNLSVSSHTPLVQ
jgi:hypothetical protein